MLWLTWQMWILLALAFAGGMIAGWIARGASDEEEETAAAPRAAAAPPTPPRPSEREKPADAPPGPAPAVEIAPASAVEEEAPGSDAPQQTAQEDLTDIRGLGPKAAATLKAEGVTSIAQIAAWTDEDVARFDQLINGRGRITRDEWVPQARAIIAARG